MTYRWLDTVVSLKIITTLNNILNNIHLFVSQKLSLFCIAVFLLFNTVLKKYTETTFNTFVIYS